MNEFVYRRAEINDLEQILKLGNLLVDFEISETKNCFWSRDTLKKCIQDPNSGLVVCALANDELAGFAIVQYNIAFSVATIDQMFILPKYRNYGLGRNLYNMIIEDAKSTGINELCMNVEFNNKSIIEFFEYNGFEKAMNNVSLKLKLD